MSSTNPEFEYYVLKLTEMPFDSDIVSVPNSWIIEQSHCKNVIFKYPPERLSRANQRVEKNEEYNDAWNIYGGKVVYGSDNYKKSLDFLTRYNNMKSNQNISISSINRQDISSTTLANETTAHIEDLENARKNTKNSRWNDQTPDTGKRSLGDTNSRKKRKISVTYSRLDNNEENSEEANSEKEDSNDDIIIVPQSENELTSADKDIETVTEKIKANADHLNLEGKYTLLCQSENLMTHLKSCLFNVPINIICYTESGLRSNLTVLDNFNVISATNLSRSASGGSLILVKNDIKAIERRDVVKLSVTNVFDISCAEFDDYILMCIYRHKKTRRYSEMDLFRETIWKVKEIASESRKYLIMCGDFKINFRGDSYERTSFMCLVRSIQLIQNENRQSTYNRSNIFVEISSVTQVFNLGDDGECDLCRRAVCVNF